MLVLMAAERRPRARRAGAGRAARLRRCPPTATTRPRRTPRAAAPRGRSARRWPPAGVDAGRGRLRQQRTAPARRRTTPPRRAPTATRARRGGAPRGGELSTKSMIGHLLGAAGAVEAIVTVQALARADRAADGQLHRAPTPSAISTTCPNAARAMTHRRRAVEQLRLRRRQRVPRPGPPAARLAKTADAGRRPRRDHRARRADRRPATAIPTRSCEAFGRAPRRLAPRTACPSAASSSTGRGVPGPRGSASRSTASACSRSIAARLALEDGRAELDRREPHAGAASSSAPASGPMESIEAFAAPASSKRARPPPTRPSSRTPSTTPRPARSRCTSACTGRPRR